MHNKNGKESIFQLIRNKVAACLNYSWKGVWRESDNTILIKILKTLNLSARSFLDANLQTRSAALTFNTVLAIVPAFALLFAIGRGFGFQNLLQDQLYAFFPSQTQAISTALSFVDSYLEHTAQGVFVGIGIVLLLWTLISLLGNVEKAFNNIWGIKKGRSIYRKLTDYTAIFLMIPILMICSSGVSIIMSSTIQEMAGIVILSSGLELLFDALPFVLTCMAFTLSFLLIPNTKVRFKYALISGIVCGIAFQLLQYLFVSGQIYVSKYNAIYGSFAFVPLFLIWLQMSWLILLFGCLLTYSAQNIFRFNFTDDISNISEHYMKNITIMITVLIVKRFEHQQPPMTINEISSRYCLPLRLATSIIDKLHDTHIVHYVMLEKDEVGVMPAIDKETFTVGELLRSISNDGMSDFIPELKQRYADIINVADKILNQSYSIADNKLIKDIPEINIKK